MGWISLLVDSQFAQLGSSEACEDLLLRVRRTVRREVNLCRSMEPLGGHLHFLQHPIRVPRAMQSYSIEMLPI